MKGADYLNYFVLPNYYFHLTAAYAILRHCGVEIGKRDFIGSISAAKDLAHSPHERSDMRVST